MIFHRWLILVLLALGLAGCATTESRTAAARSFCFERDTFAYANELVWEYSFDPESGRTTSARRDPPGEYTHHCFVVARAAAQFHQHARFDPDSPGPDLQTCHKLARRVLSRSPRRTSGDADRVIIPGYAGLREFSAAHEEFLKDEAGGAWQSYFQRGHWRMIFPFSRRHQERMATRLKHRIDAGEAPVVHVVRFPSLKINHALLVFRYSESEAGVRFNTYDPNDPSSPTELRYDRATRTFEFPRNHYYAGGPLDVYDIYRGWLY